MEKLDQDILAKSVCAKLPQKTLLAHTCDVACAYEALFSSIDSPSDFAKAWLRFFRVSWNKWEVFYCSAKVACFTHDLGKANDGFQAAVGGINGQQAIRHEHLSALFLMHSEFKDWLSQAQNLDFDVLFSAVAGHHLKLSPSKNSTYPAFPDQWQDQGSCDIRVYSDAPDFQNILNKVAHCLGLDRPKFRLPEVWSFDPKNSRHYDIYDAGKHAKCSLNNLKRTLRRDPDRHQLLMAVKTALIAADSAGSGLAREDYPIGAWLRQVFGNEQKLSQKDIKHKVLDRRIQKIESLKREPFRWHKFQEQIAQQSDRCLMLAPCGTGKTLAAWKWIASRLAHRPARRAIFLYPTRAAASEGFRDYVAHAPEAGATLMTGTACYELQDMFSNPEDQPADGRDYLPDQRLYAMGYWDKRIFSATVDQFLAFMQQDYRGLCMLPVLIDSILVIDEIHSFDNAMFDALRKFLKYFDLPVLCMTASLPTPRRESLESLGLSSFFGQGLEDLETISQLPRYCVHYLGNENDAAGQARNAYRNGKRVLWVVNTVERCQNLARDASDMNPLCYHSRFTLDDRKKRHEEVVAKFNKSKHSKYSGGILAITTQVCEMSLDMDAQVLISETAPIPALIQRMGRCNRHARPDANELGEVFIYPAESELPYHPSELRKAYDFVNDLDKEASVGQAKLETLLDYYTKNDASDSDRWMSFVEDYGWAEGGVHDFRDGLETTVPGVLCPEEFRCLRQTKKPTDGLVLPIPKRLKQRHPGLPRHLYFPKPNTWEYDTCLGFRSIDSIQSISAL